MNEWPVTFSLPQGLTIGGITTWALRLAEALTAAGREVRLVVHQTAGGHHELDPAELPSLTNGRVVRAPSMADRTAWQANVKTYGTLLPTILLPCVLARNTALAAALATAAADRIRVVGWNHSDNPYDYAYLAYYEPIIHRFVVNTRRCEDELRRRLPTRRNDIARIPHGVPVPAAVDRPPLLGRPVRLMYAGRMEQSVKRVQDIVQLAGLLCEAGVRFEMVLIGDGPQTSEVDRAIHEMSGRLHPAGSRIRREPSVPPHRMQDRWCTADISMLASRHEGLSLQMVEAMACGCVPVVSRVDSGVADFIADGQNGFTFPVGDARAMARRIVRLAGDESALRRMSSAARETVAARCGMAQFLKCAVAVFDEAAADQDRPWPPDRPLDMDAAHPSCRATIPSDAGDRMARLLDGIARRGAGPIAIYGGGNHTRALADVWAASPVEIVAIVDDDPSHHGGRLWGWPIIAPTDAAASGARSVVISSFMHEAAIWERRAPLEADGLVVFRLYGARKANDVAAHACCPSA